MVHAWPAGEKISDALADDLDAAAQRMGYEVRFRKAIFALLWH